MVTVVVSLAVDVALCVAFGWAMVVRADRAVARAEEAEQLLRDWLDATGRSKGA